MAIGILKRRMQALGAQLPRTDHRIKPHPDSVLDFRTAVWLVRKYAIVTSWKVALHDQAQKEKRNSRGRFQVGRGCAGQDTMTGDFHDTPPARVVMGVAELRWGSG